MELAQRVAHAAPLAEAALHAPHYDALFLQMLLQAGAGVAKG